MISSPSYVRSRIGQAVVVVAGFGLGCGDVARGPREGVPPSPGASSSPVVSAPSAASSSASPASVEGPARGKLVEVARERCEEAPLDEDALPAGWSAGARRPADEGRHDAKKEWRISPRRTGMRGRDVVVELLAMSHEAGRGLALYEVHLDPAAAGASEEKGMAEVGRALDAWAPRARVHDLNDICPDTYCESEFLFDFEDLTCGAGAAAACTLSFSALHANRRCIVQGQVSVPRATVRSAEAFGRAIQPPLSRWIEDHDS